MQFKRCTQGIILLGGLFAFYGVFFNDVISASVSIVLVLFIIYQYVWFINSFENTLTSIQIKRNLKQTYFLQGSDIKVYTDIKFNCGIGMSIDITEILPIGGIFSEGVITDSAKTEGPNVIQLEYIFKSAVSGEIAFGGVKVSSTNLFFKDEIKVSRKEDITPILSIYSLQSFTKEGKSFFEEEEIESLSHISSLTTHSIREYVPGDDLKHIDWKKSAKFNKLFIREYMGFDDRTVCMIIDLPDKMNDLNEAAFMKMKGVIMDYIILNMEKKLKALFIIISGGNFVKLLHSDDGKARVLQEFKNITPFNRFNHCYRNLDYSDLKMKIKDLNTHNKKDVVTLQEIYNSSSNVQKRTLFEAKMDDLFHLIEHTDIVLFSLIQGDVSHFKPILKNIKNKRGCSIHLYVPKETYQKSIEKKISKLSYSVRNISNSEGVRNYAFDKVVVI